MSMKKMFRNAISYYQYNMNNNKKVKKMLMLGQLSFKQVKCKNRVYKFKKQAKVDVEKNRA